MAPDIWCCSSRSIHDFRFPWVSTQITLMFGFHETESRTMTEDNENERGINKKEKRPFERPDGAWMYRRDSLASTTGRACMDTHSHTHEQETSGESFVKQDSWWWGQHDRKREHCKSCTDGNVEELCVCVCVCWYNFKECLWCVSHGHDINMQSSVFHGSHSGMEQGNYNLFTRMHSRTRVCRYTHTDTRIKVKIHLCVILDLIILVNASLYKPPPGIGLLCWLY